MKPKTSAKKKKGLWENPSYKNLLNPYESKYPQPKKGPASKKKPRTP